MSIWDDMVGEYLRGYDGKFYVVTHYDGKGGLYVEEVSEESARLEGSRLRMDVVPNGVQKCLSVSAVNSTYSHVHKWHRFWMDLHNNR